MRGCDTRLPERLVRRLYTEHYAVLRQRSADVLDGRPMGEPRRVPSERNVYHEWDHCIVHVLVVDLHRGGHHLREQPNGSDVLCRLQQVQVP